MKSAIEKLKPKKSLDGGKIKLNIFVSQLNQFKIISQRLKIRLPKEVGARVDTYRLRFQQHLT